MMRARSYPVRVTVAMAMVLLGVLCVGFALVKLPAQAFAVEVGEGVADVQLAQAEPMDADYCAVLHQDGTLVFQSTMPRGATDKAAEGESPIAAVYEGSLAGYASAAKVPWLQSAQQIKAVRFASDFAGLQPLSLAWWFAGCSNMRSIDLANLDASQSTTMEKMFMDCSSLVDVGNLERFDTSSSTYFGSMFRNCSSLTSLDVSHFDATHVGVLCFMFNGCSSLETLNMAGEGWRTSSLYLMVHVWENCSSLKSLDLSYLDTSGVRSMASDFKGCRSLEYLDLSGADTTGVGTLTGMFEECDSLNTVKLGTGFSFNGKSDHRQCQLPDGDWKSSVTGETYAADNVPNCVAATYTKQDGTADDVTATEPAVKVTSPKAFKAKDLKKAKAKFAAIKVTTDGKVTFKEKKNSSPKVISFKDGKVIVKKGAAKGAYTLKVKVTAKATDNYEALKAVYKIKVTVK